MKNKQGYFYIIPACLAESGDLTKAALFGLIVSLCNEKGMCWASNSYLAKKLGKSSISWISKKLSELEEEGYVSIKHQENGRIITIAFLLKTRDHALESKPPCSTEEESNISKYNNIVNTPSPKGSGKLIFSLVALFVDKCSAKNLTYYPQKSDYAMMKHLVTRTKEDADLIKRVMDEYFAVDRKAYTVGYFISSFNQVLQRSKPKGDVWATIPDRAKLSR